MEDSRVEYEAGTDAWPATWVELRRKSNHGDIFAEVTQVAIIEPKWSNHDGNASFQSRVEIVHAIHSGKDGVVSKLGRQKYRSIWGSSEWFRVRIRSRKPPVGELVERRTRSSSSSGRDCSQVFTKKCFQFQPPCCGRESLIVGVSEPENI